MQILKEIVPNATRFARLSNPAAPTHAAEIKELDSAAPTMSRYREIVETGGLLSYWVNMADFIGHAAGYVDKILKGAKPGDLPVEQPTKFELVINLKTAKPLGFTISKDMLLRADDVIR